MEDFFINEIKIYRPSCWLAYTVPMATSFPLPFPSTFPPSSEISPESQSSTAFQSSVILAFTFPAASSTSPATSFTSPATFCTIATLSGLLLLISAAASSKPSQSATSATTVVVLPTYQPAYPSSSICLFLFLLFVPLFQQIPVH